MGHVVRTYGRWWEAETAASDTTGAVCTIRVGPAGTASTGKPFRSALSSPAASEMPANRRELMVTDGCREALAAYCVSWSTHPALHQR